MSKFDENKVFVDIDKAVDKKIYPYKAVFKRYFPVFSITFIALLVTFFVLRVVHKKPYFVAAVIASDLKQIAQALEKIDYDCNILSMEHQKDHVDFLDVEKFASSEVACLNLAYPNKWKGPYLQDNPEYQSILYQMIRVKGAIFVLPGDGARLPNGKVVGKDFKVSADFDFAKMTSEGGALHCKGVPLAVRVRFQLGDWKKKLTPGQMKRVNIMFQEFEQAMPFTKNMVHKIAAC